jgi:periplasmic divalent cation tolerance protein
VDNIVVYMTASSEDEAAKIAHILVDERLAACVNIIKGLRSIYRWEGKIADEPEVMMIAKTTSEQFAALEARVRELHSYDVPEVIAIPITRGSEKYMRWIVDSVK